MAKLFFKSFKERQKWADENGWEFVEGNEQSGRLYRNARRETIRLIGNDKDGYEIENTAEK